MLVAAPERWDEACFAVPAIRALMASGLKIGVICRENQRDFWQTIAGLRVAAFPAKAKAKAAAGDLAGAWKAALVWEPGFAADAVKVAAIPRRLGPPHKKLSKLLTHPLGYAVKPLEHRVRFYLAAVEEMGVDTGNPDFFAPVDLGVPPAAGAVLLCPESDFGPSHEWLPARWWEIGGILQQRGLRITVAGIDPRRGQGRLLAERLGEGVEFFEANPLAGALPLLAVHGLVVAADGSLPHLAAHVGATCVTLFGPNDPAWKRPLGKRHAVVRRHVECAPCLAARCAMDLRCQQELTQDRVIEAIRAKLP